MDVGKYKVKTIGIGKLIMDTDTQSYNIPHLHILLLQEEDGNIQALNLEFGLVTTAPQGQEEVAIENLADMTAMYIKRTMLDGDGFDSFERVVSSCGLESFWAEYRKTEFTLARKKRDLGHSMINKIKEKVIQEIYEKYGIKPDAQFSIINGDAA